MLTTEQRENDAKLQTQKIIELICIEVRAGDLLTTAQACCLILRINWSIRLGHAKSDARREARVQRRPARHVDCLAAFRGAVVRNFHKDRAAKVVAEVDTDVEFVVRMGARHVLPEHLLDPDLQIVPVDKLEPKGALLVLADGRVDHRPTRLVREIKVVNFAPLLSLELLPEIILAEPAPENAGHSGLPALAAF